MQKGLYENGKYCWWNYKYHQERKGLNQVGKRFYQPNIQRRGIETNWHRAIGET